MGGVWVGVVSVSAERGAKCMGAVRQGMPSVSVVRFSEVCNVLVLW